MITKLNTLTSVSAIYLHCGKHCRVSSISRVYITHCESTGSMLLWEIGRKCCNQNSHRGTHTH